MQLSILLVLLSIISFGQIKWAPLGAKWYVSKTESTIPPNEGYILYEVKKDTLIQNKTVKLITKTYFHSNGVDISTMENEYTYEEDSVVYYWKNGHFYILYDFSARPGDKWTVYGSGLYRDICGYDSLGTVIVDSVSTILVNNQVLTAIYTSPGSASNWYFEGAILERIGNVRHLFPKSTACALDFPDDEGNLRCYEDNIIGIYKAGYCQIVNCNCDELKNYTGVYDFKNSYVQIYPNPVKDHFSLWVQDNNVLKDLTLIEIYNIRGERIGLLENNSENYVGFLNQGCYILKLTFRDNINYLKFIKE